MMPSPVICALAVIGLFVVPLARAEDGVTLDGAACHRLIESSASAQYVGGVDARGRPVVPAELPRNDGLFLPGEITFELLVPHRLLQGRGAHRPWRIRRRSDRGRRARLEGVLGRITFDFERRQLFYEGRALHPTAWATAVENCRRMGAASTQEDPRSGDIK